MSNSFRYTGQDTVAHTPTDYSKYYADKSRSYMNRALDASELSQSSARRATIEAATATQHRDDIIMARDETITARNTTVTMSNDAEQYRDAAQAARTGAEKAETNAKTHATNSATSASTAADILAANQALGITVDNSVGTRVYVGDTMIHGDTGWRDVSDLLINGWTGTAIQMKRENSTVTISMSGGSFAVNGTDATSNQFIQLPVGFLPRGGNYVFIGWVSTATGRTPVSVDKEFQTLSLGVRDRVIGQISYITGADWPTSLPGTPA